MKKTKIIVPAIAVLALGMAASVSATVAWFQVANASIAAGDVVTGSVKASTTSSNLGSFTVTPQLDVAISNSNVVLSDKDGNVYTETNGVKVNVNGQNAITTTYVNAQVKFLISYSGQATSADEVLGLWNAAAADSFVATISDTTAYSASVPSTAIGTEWSKAANSGWLDGTDFGLKFRTADVSRSENGWTNAGTGTHTGNTLASSTFSLDNPGTFSGSSGTYTVTSSVKATFHVGIVGMDGVVQTSSDAYSFNISVSGGGIAS